MSLPYGVQFTAYYYAYDTANDAYKTGDAANHSLQWTKDGTDAATTNSAAEVDATNSPGLYKVTITATEAQCLSGSLSGKSSTSDIVLVTKDYEFLRLPNVAPAAENGLPICNAAGNTKVDVQTIKTRAVTDVGDGQTVYFGASAWSTLDAAGIRSAVGLAGANLDTQLSGISGYVDCLPVTLDGSTFTNLPAVTLTEQQETDLVAAIEAEIADDATGEAVKQAIVDKLIENLPDLDDLTLAAIAQSVWGELLTSITTTGSIGKLIKDYLDAAVSSRLAAAGYTAPDNTGVGNIYAIVSSLTHGNAALLTAINLRMLASSYVAAPTVSQIREEMETEGGTLALAKASADSAATAAGSAQTAAEAAQTAAEAIPAPPTVEEIDAELSASHGAGSWEQAAGATPANVAIGGRVLIIK